VLNSHIVRKIAVVFAGTALSRAVSFITMLLMVRSFMPEDFALYAIVDMVIGFTTGAVTTGANWMMIRSVSRNGIENSERVIKSSLLYQSTYAAIIAILIYAYARYIASVILNKPDSIEYVRIAAFGVIGHVLFAFRSSLYQSAKRFRSDAKYNVISSTLFLLVVTSYIYLLNGRSMIPVCIAHVSVPAVVSIIALRKTMNIRIQSFKVHSVVSGMLVSLRKHNAQWLLVYSIMLWLNGHIHMIVITSYRPLEEIGVFTLAMKIYMMTMIVTNSVRTVLMPQLSSIANHSKIKEEIKKVLPITTVIAITILLIVPLLKPLIVPIIGTKYADAVAPLSILLVGTGLATLLSPYVSALFSLGEYKIFATGGIALVMSSIVLSMLFTTKYGGIAAAAVITSTYFLMNAYFTIAVAMRLKRADR